LERLRVLISTTDTNPASFTSISSCGYISVPAEWTEYAYNLLQWKQQSVYIAWQCVSWDSFALYLDDIIITGQDGYVPITDEVLTPALPVAYPNPAQGAFSISNPGKARFDLEIYDLRGRKLFTQAGLVEFNSAAHGLRLPSGIYILKVTTSGQAKLQRIAIFN
jgi:hypothetical protein